MDLVDEFKSWIAIKNSKGFDSMSKEEKMQAVTEYEENTEQFAARRRAAIRALRRNEKL